MTKDQVKKILTAVVPLLVAIGATYGYVDQSCVCSAPDVIPDPPVVLDAPDASAE